MNPKKSFLDCFTDFVSDPAGLEPEDIQEALKLEGVDVSSLEQRVRNLVLEQSKNNWRERMQEEDMTQYEMVKLAVEATDGYPFTLKEISQAVPELKTQQVSACLTTLKNRRVIMHATNKGEWQVINHNKPIQTEDLIPPPPAEPEQEEFALEELTIEQIRGVLSWFTEDYLASKEEIKRLRQQNSDLWQTLQKFFGDMRKAKIIPAIHVEDRN